MNPLTSRPAPDWTVEQLRQHFGMIPADRILRDPPAGTATEKDILALDSRRGYPAELVDGVLLDRMAGVRGALVATKLLCRLMAYLDDRNLGIAIPAAKCPVRLQQGLVRLASIYFISWDKMPGGRIPEDPIADLVPDMVIEILSRWCTRLEMFSKRRQFLAAGTQLFWLLDIEARTVEVSTPQRTKRLGFDDTLEGGGLLPSFSINLGELFAPPRRASAG